MSSLLSISGTSLPSRSAGVFSRSHVKSALFALWTGNAWPAAFHNSESTATTTAMERSIGHLGREMVEEEEVTVASGSTWARSRLFWRKRYGKGTRQLNRRSRVSTCSNCN